MDPGVKLLVTIYLGYIIATIYNFFFKTLSSHFQCIYFILTSFCLYYWNFGTDIVHPLLTIFLQWILLKSYGGSRNSVLVTFIFQLGYYLIGIMMQEMDEYGHYPLNWLTPQCVLLLRMIGLAFDMFDGHKEPASLSSDQKESAFYAAPTLTEMLAFSFFPGGFLIGPQFSLVRLRKLMDGKLIENSEPLTQQRYQEAGKQMLIGTSILLVQQLLNSWYFTPVFYTSKEFLNLNFLGKILFVCVTGHLSIIKYLAIWTVNDGVCVITGLGYRKSPETEKVSWDAVSNSKLLEFTRITKFKDLIGCYNINTNAWVLKYVHKRLRFLNMRLVSHFCSLFFLAIWHGFHVGYFTVFALQFLVMNAERAFMEVASCSYWIQEMWAHPKLGRLISSIGGFIYVHAFLGYCMIEFTLLKWNIYKPVMDSIYWYGHLFFASMWITSKLCSFLFCTPTVPTYRKNQ